MVSCSETLETLEYIVVSFYIGNWVWIRDMLFYVFLMSLSFFLFILLSILASFRPVILTFSINLQHKTKMATLRQRLTDTRRSIW